MLVFVRRKEEKLSLALRYSPTGISTKIKAQWVYIKKFNFVNNTLRKIVWTTGHILFRICMCKAQNVYLLCPLKKEDYGSFSKQKQQPYFLSVRSLREKRSQIGVYFIYLCIYLWETAGILNILYGILSFYNETFDQRVVLGQASGLSPSLWIACDRSCRPESAVRLPLIVRTVLISTKSRESLKMRE